MTVCVCMQECVCVHAGMCAYDGACITYNMCDGALEELSKKYKGLFFAHE